MAHQTAPSTFKNPLIRWVDERLPIFTLLNKEYAVFPTPKNFNYLWNFGALAMFMLVVMIATGVVLALVMSLATWLWFRDPRLAITVGLALVANIFVAAVGGILAPLALEKMGRDPAVSSSIFITFLTDFMGFFAVLAIAAWILL